MKQWKKFFTVSLIGVFAFLAAGCFSETGTKNSSQNQQEEQLTEIKRSETEDAQTKNSQTKEGETETAPMESYAYREPEHMTGSGFSSGMFAPESLDNTWLFGGGVEAQGRFAEVGGIRNYVGQFEEYIRWTKRVDSSLLGMQRYTVNVGKEGADAVSFAEELDGYIEKLDPKAVSYLIGPEDYKSNERGKDAFKKALKKIINTALVMRQNNGYIVIQLPHMPKEEGDFVKAAEYAGLAKEAVREVILEDETKGERIAVVDHLAETNDEDFQSNMLTEKGLLNAKGHYEIAKQLAEIVYGTSEDFPVISGSWEAEVQPDSFSDGLSEVTEEKSEQNKRISQEIRKMTEDKSRSLTWLFIGDSITHGAECTYGYDSIAQLFEKYLKEDLGRTDDIVINTGVVGATAETTFAHINERMTKYHPDIVSVMLGTNDTKDGENPAYPNQLKEIAAKIREANPKAVIIFRSPTPGTEEWTKGLSGKHGAVAQMKATASEDKNILFIDQYTDWNAECAAYPYLFDKEHYFGDGEVHPGAAGHLRMARQFIRECGLDIHTEIANLSYRFAYVEEKSDIIPQAERSGQALTVSKKDLNDVYTDGEIGEITVRVTDLDGKIYEKSSGLKEDNVTLNLSKDVSGVLEVTAKIKGSQAKIVAFAKQQI